MPTAEIVRISCEITLVILIWIIQLAVYPRLSKVGKSEQARWHLHYTLLITAIISPLIILHFGLLLFEWRESGTFFNSLRLLLSIVVIISTVFALAPQHLKIIVFGPDDKTFHKITQRNWTRTIAWTASLILSLIH